jgi:putative variant SH3 domain protein
MWNKKLIYLFVILLAFISAAVYIYVTLFMPSGKRVEHSTYYGVKDDRVAIIYNDGLQTASAIAQDKEVYLPYDWASAILNDKLFWDAEENILVYTLPEEILYMDENHISEGKKVFIKSDDITYVSISFIKKYTNVNLRVFTDSDIKKVYIYNDSLKLMSAKLKKKSQLRVAESIKSDIVADLDKEETVYMLVSTDSNAEMTAKDKKWIKAYTDKGDWGCVQIKSLENIDFVVNISEFVKPV